MYIQLGMGGVVVYTTVVIIHMHAYNILTYSNMFQPHNMAMYVSANDFYL